MRRTLPVALFVAFNVAAGAALAEPTKEECIDTNSKAQALRIAGKMRAARDALRLCGSPSCPVMVRDDCQQRLDDLERVLPTVVFAAKDATGHDLLSVKVTMDGEPLTDKLDGAALPVDIGDHEFAFEAAGKPVVKQHFVMHEGEKRQETITIADGKELQPATVTIIPQPTPSPTKPAPVPNGKTQRAFAIALGALAVIGIGVGSGTGVMAFSSWSSAQSECLPGACGSGSVAQSDKSTASTAATISTISFALGGVALLGSVICFVIKPSHGAQRAWVPAAGGLKWVF